MRRTTRLATLVAIALSVMLIGAACGDDDDDGGGTPSGTNGGTAAPGTGAGGGEDISVGLLYDVTGRGDLSFNDAAAAGLDRAIDEFGISSTESTPTGDADRAERIRLLVDEGNDLVIGVGFLWADAVTEEAESSPDTEFAIVDSVVDLPNVRSLVFAEEEGSFLMGVAAALKSETKKVGFIGGVETDLIKKFEAGFVAGVHAVDESIEVDVKYITQPPDFSGFNDPLRGKEIALGQYEAGADVIYAAAGGSGLGMFEAAMEVSQSSGTKVWGIGVDSDQYNLVEEAQREYVLTSMLKKVDVAVYETIKAYVEGTFEAGTQVFDLEAGGVDYATSGGFVDDIADQLDDYKQRIIDGEIDVPSTP